VAGPQAWKTEVAHEAWVNASREVPNVCPIADIAMSPTECEVWLERTYSSLWDKIVARWGSRSRGLLWGGEI